MFVHLLLHNHPCKCKIVVYFFGQLLSLCAVVVRCPWFCFPLLWCLVSVAVMTGIRFINFAWCRSDSFSEHPTLGLICIVGDVSHYTVFAGWMASVYVVKVLCIFLVLPRFFLGFAFVVLQVPICNASASVMRGVAAFAKSTNSSSDKFACAWEKISLVVSGNR